MLRAILFPLAAGFFVCGCDARAERLPGLDGRKWLGFYVAHESRKFEWGIRQDGTSALYLLDRRERIERKDKPELRCILEEKIDGRWVRRRYDDEAFAYSHPPSTSVEETTITFNFTGETKVALTQQFSEDGVTVSPRVVEKKTTNPLRVGLEFVLPEVWKPSGDEELRERDLKRRIEDAEIRAVRSGDGKKLRYELWESVTLADDEHLGPGAEEVRVEIAKFGPDRIFLRPGADETPLRVTHSGPLYAGFKVEWFPDLEKLGEEGCQLEITVE